MSCPTVPAAFTADYANLSNSRLWRGKIIRNAKLAVSDLGDDDLAAVLVEELRKRPSSVAEEILRQVVK